MSLIDFRWEAKDLSGVNGRGIRGRSNEEHCVARLSHTSHHPETLNYNKIHFLPFFFLTARAALVAVSKTSLTPSLVLAEHSR